MKLTYRIRCTCGAEWESGDQDRINPSEWVRKMYDLHISVCIKAQKNGMA